MLSLCILTGQTLAVVGSFQACSSRLVVLLQLLLLEQFIFPLYKLCMHEVLQVPALYGLEQFVQRKSMPFTVACFSLSNMPACKGQFASPQLN